LLQNLNITKKKLKMNVNKILCAGGRNLAMWRYIRIFQWLLVFIRWDK
jgi:phosphoribosylaminoimidazole (AIR) synthetase